MSMTKVVIVTGASRGIGKAIVELLAKPLQNCGVVAVARSKEPLAELVGKLGDDRVTTVQGDLTDASVAQKAVDAALNKWSRLDALVINHGALDPIKKIASASVDEWKRSFDINVFSAIGLIQAALPALRKSRGRIIFTSSGAAMRGTSTWGAYSASKAVINHLAMTLAEEEPDIISVAVRPGVVDTEMQALLAENFGIMEKKDVDKYSTLRKEGKMLRPEQPGNVIGRLALDAGKELNGIFVNWDDKEKLAKFQDL